MTEKSIGEPLSTNFQFIDAIARVGLLNISYLLWYTNLSRMCYLLNELQESDDQQLDYLFSDVEIYIQEGEKHLRLLHWENSNSLQIFLCGNTWETIFTARN